MTRLGTLDVAQEGVVILYDTQSGEILHRHEVYTEKGGAHPNNETMERDAREQFLKAQPGRKAEAAALHVNPAVLKPRTLYKIDLQKKALVEHPVQLGKFAAVR